MIPILDLEGGSYQANFEQLVSTLSSVGFIYLRNHGVPSENIADCQNLFRDFFTKDIRFKDSFRENRENPFMGYKPCETERLDPAQKEKDMREAMVFSAHDIGANSFPDDAIEAAVKSLVDKLGLLSAKLLEMIGLGLGLLDPKTILNAHSAFAKRVEKKTSKSFTTYGAISYPKLEGQLKEGQVLCGEHADYGSVTLLMQDHVGGLEVQNCDGKFIEATPIPDTILVNIGLLLENWTNGRLRATRHRIIRPTNESRLSMVLFVHPDDDILIEPLEELRTEDGRGRYEGVVDGDASRNLYSESLQ